MNKAAKKCLFAVTVLGMCLALAGCSSHKCDWCGKDFSGATYYAGMGANAHEEVVCRECAQNYWAPLNVENFRR